MTEFCWARTISTPCSPRNGHRTNPDNRGDSRYLLAARPHQERQGPRQTSPYGRIGAFVICAHVPRVRWVGRQVCMLTTLGRDKGEIEQYLHNNAAITINEADIIRVAARLYLCK